MVSGVSFRANNTMQSARDILNNPQAQTRSQGAQSAPAAGTEMAPAPKKKHTALKVIGGLVAAAAIIATGLGVTHGKGGFEKLAEAAAKTDAGKITQWANKAVTACRLDKAGEFIATNATKCWNAVAGIFKKGAEEGGAAA